MYVILCMHGMHDSHAMAVRMYACTCVTLCNAAYVMYAMFSVCVCNACKTCSECNVVHNAGAVHILRRMCPCCQPPQICA